MTTDKTSAASMESAEMVTPAMVEAEDMCDLIGVRSDGTQVNLGKAPMPPLMKAKDIVRSYFGSDFDDEMSNDSMALQCCREVIDYMQRTNALAQQAVAAPVEAHVGDSNFEGWFAEKNMAGLGTKQLCRDAYAAGMSDPLAAPTPAEPAQQDTKGESSRSVLIAREIRAIAASQQYPRPASAVQQDTKALSEDAIAALYQAVCPNYDALTFHRIVRCTEAAHGIGAVPQSPSVQQAAATEPKALAELREAVKALDRALRPVWQQSDPAVKYASICAMEILQGKLAALPAAQKGE